MCGDSSGWGICIQHGCKTLALVFPCFYYFTAVLFFLLVSIKLLSKKQNLKVLPFRVCVCAPFFLAHSTSQKTWSQASCHGSTVGTDDVAQVHTSQLHPHWQMPLTSNTIRACLLTEQQRAVSIVASQQDISERRCQFLQVLSVSEAFFSSGLQAPSQICLVFTFSRTQVCKHSHVQKIKAEANASLDARYPSCSQRNSKKCSQKQKNHSQRLPCKPAKNTYLVQLCTELRFILSLPSTPTSLPTQRSSAARSPQYEHLLQFREEREDTSQAHHTGEGKARRCQMTTPQRTTVQLYIEKGWNR